jgi:chromate transporter
MASADGVGGAETPVFIERVSMREALNVWARIACLSFGGPAGQISVMHRILVDEKKWVSEGRFLHALNFCMLLPGPEAQQLATYIGWLMHGVRGGVMAGGLFILPGVVAIMALSWLYVVLGHAGVVAGLFLGLKAAVLAIVLQAVLRIGRRALRSSAMVGLAAAAFVAIFALHIAFPVIIAAAGAIGFVGRRLGIPAFCVASGHGDGADLVDRQGRADEPAASRLRRAIGSAAPWLLLWLVPVALLIAFAGAGSVFTQIAVFFSKMATVTFGGAYAVLAYVAQEAVGTYGWLKPGEMLDGLGMAETTPGPLVMVLQFVGFMAAYRQPGMLAPMLAGVLGGLLATWVTFIPCFLWIFLFAPFVESLRGNAALGGALSAITAAVVGVILNLAIWFAIHALFASVTEVGFAGLTFDLPDPASVNYAAVALTAGAALAIFWLRAGMITTIIACAALGMGLSLAI